MDKFIGLQLDGGGASAAQDETELPEHGVVTHRVTQVMTDALQQGMSPLTIVIGAEHAAPDLRSFSLIASTAVDGATIRTVGVIGPLRMHYSRAITLVDGTTQAVSRVLRDSN